MPDEKERVGDLERRRAEASAWFSDGPGGVALALFAIVVVVLLVLTALGLI